MACALEMPAITAITARPEPVRPTPPPQATSTRSVAARPYAWRSASSASTVSTGVRKSGHLTHRCSHSNDRGFRARRYRPNSGCCPAGKGLRSPRPRTLRPSGNSTTPGPLCQGVTTASSHCSQPVSQIPGQGLGWAARAIEPWRSRTSWPTRQRKLGCQCDPLVSDRGVHLAARSELTPTQTYPPRAAGASTRQADGAGATKNGTGQGFATSTPKRPPVARLSPRRGPTPPFDGVGDRHRGRRQRLRRSLPSNA